MMAAGAPILCGLDFKYAVSIDEIHFNSTHVGIPIQNSLHLKSIINAIIFFIIIIIYFYFINEF